MRRSVPLLSGVLLLAATAAGAPVMAQEPTTDPVGDPVPEVPAADQPLRDSLHRAIERVAGLEQGLLHSFQAGDTAAVAAAQDPVSDARSLLEGLLERAVMETPWGPAELERLRAEYPRAAVLDRYAARVAVRDGRAIEALPLIDRLLQRDPGDPELHRLRARSLEALGRTRDARMAWLRAYDIEPVETASFRALVRLADGEEGLDSLLTHVRRLRRMEPGLEALREQEIELLQRLGRLHEARAVPQIDDPRPGGGP